MFWLLALLCLLAIVSLLAVFPIAIVRWLELHESRRVIGAAVVASILISVGTSLFMEVTIRKFARRAHEPIRGLILRPVAGGDHEYTPRGREYELAAFQRPFFAGTAAALLAAIFCTILAPKPRGPAALAIWSAVSGAVALMFLFWLCREFTTWEIFI